MSEQTPDPAGRGLARRRLLRGTFAAPAVLTIYSGGALAATSATCVAKAQGSPQTGEVVAGTPGDTYLRVQLHQVTSGGNTPVTEYWLARDSINSFVGASNIVADPGRFTRFLIDSNSLSTANNEVNKQQPQATLSDPPYWVALRFDGTGTLVGVGATGGGSAITHSCWTSAL